MKSLRLGILLLVSLTNLYTAPPRFYVTGQIGQFDADAGTVEGMGFDPIDGHRAIKSGAKVFSDFAVGAECNSWFSLEAGYVHFDSFSSPWAESPYSTPTDPIDFRQFYRLQAYRITPVIRFSLNERFKLQLIGGLTRSEIEITTGEFSSSSTNHGIVSSYRTTTADYATNSYHVGMGLACNLSETAVIEARVVHYDFGRIIEEGSYRRSSYPGNRISANTYALGFSWRFPVTTAGALPPRFYLAGQIGRFAADAGSSSQFHPGMFADRAIKSGAKTFTDWSIGTELLDWLSLEVGYVDFASFSSGVFQISPGVIIDPVTPVVSQVYKLRAYRLTPVFKILSSDRFSLTFLGGLTHSMSDMTERDSSRFGYERSVDIAKDSYHLGFGVACKLVGQAVLEARYVLYDFGKPQNAPNRITANTCSAGLFWRF
jgi:hypothetical protein